MQSKSGNVQQESLNEMLERIRKENAALHRLIEAIDNQYVLKMNPTKKSKSKQSNL